MATITAAQKQQLAEMIKDGERWSLYGHYAKIVWDIDEHELYYYEHGCVAHHGDEHNVEIMRFVPHSLKGVYDRKGIDWDAPNYDETPEYLELLHWHLNSDHSDLNVNGMVENIARLMAI